MSVVYESNPIGKEKIILILESYLVKVNNNNIKEIQRKETKNSVICHGYNASCTTWYEIIKEELLGDNTNECE